MLPSRFEAISAQVEGWGNNTQRCCDNGANHKQVKIGKMAVSDQKLPLTLWVAATARSHPEPMWLFNFHAEYFPPI